MLSAELGISRTGIAACGAAAAVCFPVHRIQVILRTLCIGKYCLDDVKYKIMKIMTNFKMK